METQVEGREVRWIVRWRALKSGGSTTTPPLHLFFDEPRTCKLEKISEMFSTSVETGVHGTGARKNSEIISKSVEIGVHGTGARKKFRKNFKKFMTL